MTLDELKKSVTEKIRFCPKLSLGIIFRPSAWWIGAQWFPAMDRLCIQILPCISITVEIE